jgi:hypothetical protein
VFSGLNLGPLRFGVRKKHGKFPPQSATASKRYKVDQIEKALAPIDHRCVVEKKYDILSQSMIFSIKIPDDSVPTKKQLYLISKGLALIAEAFNEEHHAEQTSD